MHRTLPIVLAAGALILSTACGGSEESAAPQPSATPLPGAPLSCQEAGPGPELIACDEDAGIAVTYAKEAYTSTGIKEVNQYFLVPLRVTSAEDWRQKRDRGLEWDIWERLNIDICEVKLVIEPNSLMFQLKLPEDVVPPECRINAQE
jgi:hypothetical protein